MRRAAARRTLADDDMTFDEFIAAAWSDHGDRPEEVAARLASSFGVIAAPADIPRYAGLATHVFGEHLGQWEAGVGVLQRLRSHSAFDASAPVASAIDRGIAVLRYASGSEATLGTLARDDRIAALAAAAAMLAGRNAFARALPAFSAALDLAAAGVVDGSPALRALAVGGNNLAAALQGKADRDAIETAGMVRAAEAGLEFWKRAGTWLEEERAEYQLARSLVAAGRPDAAAQHAQRCLDLCVRNDAPPLEFLYGYIALALAARAADDPSGFATARELAEHAFAQLAPSDRPSCEADLHALDA